MPVDPRVHKLIEEMIESGSSADEVCRDAPELLAQVRAGWERMRALEARLDECFPEPGSTGERDLTPLDEGLAEVPGYDTIEELGRGGVGVVYKAVHRKLRRTVALKMLLVGAFATRAERRRFAREAELVAELRHPNVVQVYDVGDLGGRPYFTMEFVDGGSLAERVAGTPLPAREAAAIVATLADAVAAAHRAGVVHRDLKPSNVLLTADGMPKVSDFGLARHLEVESSLTLSGAVVGTPSYMAPEQAQGRTREIGPASDLYALGAILYELLTGRPPFRAESASETLYQVITHDPAPPSRLNTKVPRDLETICLKCLRKDPRSRYPDSGALADDLRRFGRGDAIAARPENGLQRLARRVRRRPVFSAGVAGAALIMAIMVVGGLVLISERAATIRSARVEQATRERAAEDDADEMARRLEESAWPEAASALERAKVRLGGGGSADLRRRLDRGRRDLELVARLDAIHMSRSTSPVEAVEAPRSARAYEAAFGGAGLGRVGEATEAVAARIKASNVKTVLVAALDDWAVCETDPSRRSWLLAVARAADHDPAGWRDRARDPAVRRDPRAFAGVIKAAPVADRCIPLLLALEMHLYATGQDSLPFLTRIQEVHPGDFWVNARLGALAGHRGNYAEGIRYFQSALAVRPDSSMCENYLGVFLLDSGHREEAVHHLRRTVALKPTDASCAFNLAAALRELGRYDEAIDLIRSALRRCGDAPLLHAALGDQMESKGRPVEAVAEYREAVRREPTLYLAHHRLRTLLMRQGRLEEARAAWQAALATNPPDHDDWYGYAEFCLYLGQEDEYRRARRALLARFGGSTEPMIAERTARACLLLPDSGDELRDVVALGERAWTADRKAYGPTFPFFLFLQGLAEYRQGRFDRAMELMQGDASRVLGPAPRLVLAMAQHRRGKMAEARETLAAAVAGHDWRASEVHDQDDWICHALRREAERLIDPDLPAFLRGDH